MMLNMVYMSKAYKVNKLVFFSSPIYINHEKPKKL